MLPQLLWFAGVVLLLLVFSQVALVLTGSVRRLRLARVAATLEQQILEEKLATARAQRQRAEDHAPSWNGNRKFRVDRKVPECADVCSFYLKAHDHKPLAAYHPGQFLTFELAVPGHPAHLVRCYSLSDRPRAEHYRVTIKRISAPHDKPAATPGAVSSFFHDVLKEGDLVDVRAPAGGFFLNPDRESPVVLIAGGVGVTPLLSMANEIVESGSKRETWFFFGVRNSADHIAKAHLEQLARENENVRLNVCYSQPRPDDAPGRDFQHAGHVSIDLLKRLLPSSNYNFYICGPGPLMETMTHGLREWGVPDTHVFFEAFGPASVKKIAPPLPSDTAALTKLKVKFNQSGKEFRWNPFAGSLLEYAEANGIASIPSNCRTGNCGTCKVAIRSGKVKYLKKPGFAVEAGSCLTCCCTPETDLALDC